LRGCVGGIVALSILALFGAVLIGGAALAYGFLDAYSSSRTREDIRLRAIARSWWSLNYDSMEIWTPIEHGAIFIVLEWVQPPGKVLSKLRLSGTAWEGNTKLEDFSDLCQRGSSTNLRRNTVQVNAYIETINQDPVCFIRLKTKFPFEQEPNGNVERTELERIHARVNGVTLRDLRYEAEASNRPMRYITWTENSLRAAWVWVVSTVSYPFARE